MVLSSGQRQTVCLHFPEEAKNKGRKQGVLVFLQETLEDWDDALTDLTSEHLLLNEHRNPTGPNCSDKNKEPPSLASFN